MGIRKNAKNLTSAERGNFVNAVKELHRQGGYQPFVNTHVAYARPPMFGPSFAHFTSSFLPWHRYFLLEFERALQRIDSSVTIPYWNFTAQRSTSGVPWTSDFMGGNGTGTNRAVTTGPFRQGRWVINTFTTDDFLKRGFGVQVASLPPAPQLQTIMAMTVYSAPPWDGTPADAFVGHLEGWADTDGGNMHNQVHTWIGGTILSGASPADPVFWLLHCFLDRCWADWQALHPGAAKYLPDTPVGDKFVDLNMPMEPWGEPVTPAALIDHTQWYTYQ